MKLRCSCLLTSDYTYCKKGLPWFTKNGQHRKSCLFHQFKIKTQQEFRGENDPHWLQPQTDKKSNWKVVSCSRALIVTMDCLKNKHRDNEKAHVHIQIKQDVKGPGWAQHLTLVGKQLDTGDFELCSSAPPQFYKAQNYDSINGT